MNEFLQELKDVFDVITPECHYLIHYARLISSYGPLRPLLCKRFESKHLYFKNVSSTCKNFMNITASLSKRHQLKQCGEFSSRSMLCDYEKVTGTNVSTPFTSLPKELQTTLKSHKKCQAIDFAGKTIQCVKEACLNNVKYVTRCICC